MRLVDSNIVIYASKAGFESLRLSLIDAKDIAASDITYIEVVGYNKYTEDVKLFLEGFFESIKVLPITSEIVEKAVEIRKIRVIGLGDSIIAATALIHDLALITNNEKDFSWIEGLTIINPLR